MKSNNFRNCLAAVVIALVVFQAGGASAQIELKDADASFIGEHALGAFGHHQFSIVGDIDGDGLDDIAIGASEGGCGGTDSGMFSSTDSP